MITTSTKQYSPSINIKRDLQKSLAYIATPNAKQVAEQVLEGIHTGVRSHLVVGAYGSGKSIFLWAFSKTIAQHQSYFDTSANANLGQYHVINIIGEYRSILAAFAEEFELGAAYAADDVLKSLHKTYTDQQAVGKNVLIVIDEFGKFLEYAAKNNPEKELYFIQELAEYVNDADRKLLFIATLHQNFSAYGFHLTKQQQSEWNKVQGRFHEIIFNEPVEQLLFLASEILDLTTTPPPASFTPLFKAIKRSRSFPLRDYLTEDIAKKLYPLDILSAAILTLALQRYGQNERSLFSFLSSPDHLGIAKQRDSDYYTIADVYDYLKHSFSIINTKHNPHFIQWGAIASSLERIEGIFGKDLPDAELIVKTIGLLGIFGHNAMELDDNFLEEYGKRALGISKPSQIVKKLADHRIIRYTQYNKRYLLFEGTDLDIELAIDEAGNLVERVGNIADLLKAYFDFQVVLAKAVYYQRGTPRFFKYLVSDTLETIYANDEIDGYINLIFNDTLKVEDVLAAARKSKAPVLYCLYENTTEIQKILFDIRKIEKVIENNLDDRVAVRELKQILNYQKRLLNHYVLDTFNQPNNAVRWVDEEGECVIRNERELNQRLSHICNRVYHATPHFSSELINKTQLTGAIRTAQKEFLQHLVHDYFKADWGFAPHLFPPAKSIFYALVREKGILYLSENGEYGLRAPQDESFRVLWEKCEGFLESTRTGQRSLRELAEILTLPPLKLKYGFAQFWLPLFLFIKRNDYALYHEDAYMPNLTPETLEIILKNPHQYFLKAFQIGGIDLELFKYYRRFVQQTETNPSNATLVETIRPFLNLYRDLPDYSKTTARISKEAQRVRDAIAKAKDPEGFLLRDIPAALGDTKQELVNDEQKAAAFIQKLEAAITELRTSYEDLERRFATHIQKTFGYENLQDGIQQRFSALQQALLTNKQQSFFLRLISDLEHSPWLSALCQALLSKPLKNISDKDEAVLYQSFTREIEMLDNLCDLSKMATDTDSLQNAILVDIHTVGHGRTRQVVQLSPDQKNRVEIQKKAILAALSDDQSVSIAVITTVLKDLLDGKG